MAYSWSAYGSEVMAYVHKELRPEKLSEHAGKSVFLGWDRTVVNGIKVGVLKEMYELQEDPLKKVVTATAGAFHPGKFPLIRW